MLRKLKLLWAMTFIGVMILPVLVLLMPLEDIQPQQQLARYFFYAAAALFMLTLLMSKLKSAWRMPAEPEDGRDEMRKTQYFMALVGLADAPLMMGLVYYLLSRDTNGLMITVALTITGFLLIRPAAPGQPGNDAK